MNEDAGNWIQILARSDTLFIGLHSPTFTAAEDGAAEGKREQVLLIRAFCEWQKSDLKSPRFTTFSFREDSSSRRLTSRC